MRILSLSTSGVRIEAIIIVYAREGMISPLMPFVEFEVNGKRTQTAFRCPPSKLVWDDVMASILSCYIIG
ncbi:hypothetical protein CDAR_507471 [Caerostris darwini]|uniref:Uncharacterized protein n=1 Tax=Caerostris darwini TaxID=1538125 RepID=A0AAV4R3I8_9ARAC|nr:hypothetical protein CDAR_507471 [Caerostris darwini]